MSQKNKYMYSLDFMSVAQHGMLRCPLLMYFFLQMLNGKGYDVNHVSACSTVYYTGSRLTMPPYQCIMQ